MANHLISPITIDGAAYCCACEGGRSTKGVLTEDILFNSYPEIQTAVITNDCSPWQVMTGSQSSYQFYEPEGELSFGVSCGEEVNLDFVSSSTGGSGSDDYDIDVEVFVDGVSDTTFTMEPSSSTNSGTITVTGSPCGSIVTIYAQSMSSGGDVTTTATLTVEVTSIT
jgi:hypothetical protein